MTTRNYEYSQQYNGM